MIKQKKMIIWLSNIIIVLLCILLFLLKEPKEQLPNLQGNIGDEVTYLFDYGLMDVKSVHVENRNGTYDVRQEGGGFIVHDISAELVNGEYLQMLLDECRVGVSGTIDSQHKDISDFGLDKPQSIVKIEFLDGSQKVLRIGKEEAITKGFYAAVEGDDNIYLIPRSHCVRFIMPVENYINYQITPTRKDEVLRVVKSFKLSGKAFPEPIFIKAVDEKNEDDLREAASFGAATHIITAPALHEIDQTVVSEVFQSLLGLMSEGIVAYNCSEETMEANGFSEPFIQADYDIQNGVGNKIEHYTIKVAKQKDGSLYASCNDNGVIYKILPVAFTKYTYADYVMRWFLTPFNTDLKQINVSYDDVALELELTGDSVKNIEAYMDGQQLDIESFRGYYRLLTSAMNDGDGLIDGSTVNTSRPVFSVRYVYRDEKKSDDIMKLYEIDQRKIAVEVNGKIEFSMKMDYVARVKEAKSALESGETVQEAW